MFDLMELDQAETALRAIAGGDLPEAVRLLTPIEHNPADGARCPYLGGTPARTGESRA